jgi:hypothetical protein
MGQIKVVVLGIGAVIRFRPELDSRDLGVHA